MPSQITAPSEQTSQVHSLIPNILASMNKPTVTNVYFRAGTSHEGNRLYDKCKDPQVSIHISCGTVDDFINHPSPSTTMAYRRALCGLHRLMSYAQISMTPLTIKRGMWFLHEGVSPHFSSAVAHHLRWTMLYDGLVQSPYCSPNLNLSDIHLWDTLKTKVYCAVANHWKSCRTV